MPVRPLHVTSLNVTTHVLAKALSQKWVSNYWVKLMRTHGHSLSWKLNGSFMILVMKDPLM
jgi:hypothetical protein